MNKLATHPIYMALQAEFCAAVGDPGRCAEILAILAEVQATACITLSNGVEDKARTLFESGRNYADECFVQLLPNVATHTSRQPRSQI